MSSVDFYDDDWQRLLRRHPLIARKIEDLRCEVVSDKEFEELRKRVEQLEKMAHPEVKYGEKDFDRLFWENLQGTKGLFQRTSKRANNNSQIFQALQSVLKEHNGFCHIGAHTYWFDNRDPDVIDRRKK